MIRHVLIAGRLRSRRRLSCWAAWSGRLQGATAVTGPPWPCTYLASALTYEPGLKQQWNAGSGWHVGQ